MRGVEIQREKDWDRVRERKNESNKKVDDDTNDHGHGINRERSDEEMKTNAFIIWKDHIELMLFHHHLL